MSISEEKKLKQFYLGSLTFTILFFIFFAIFLGIEYEKFEYLDSATAAVTTKSQIQDSMYISAYDYTLNFNYGGEEYIVPKRYTKKYCGKDREICTSGKLLDLNEKVIVTFDSRRPQIIEIGGIFTHYIPLIFTGSLFMIFLIAHIHFRKERNRFRKNMQKYNS